MSKVSNIIFGIKANLKKKMTRDVTANDFHHYDMRQIVKHSISAGS